jgi:serine/threonine protein phosphatase 1
MPSQVIAIGDIHGCARALRTVIEAIQPQGNDTLIPLGDCIDRGPDSRQVIDELLRLRERCNLIPLLGNHEEMMLNVLDGKPQPELLADIGHREMPGRAQNQACIEALLKQSYSAAEF